MDRSVKSKSGTGALLDDLDASSTVARPSTRAAEPDGDPLDSLRSAVRARPEGGPRQRTTAPSSDAGRRYVVGDRGQRRAGGTSASLPPGGGSRRRAWNEERVALAVAVAVDDCPLLTSAYLDSLLQTGGATHFHLQVLITLCIVKSFVHYLIDF